MKKTYITPEALTVVLGSKMQMMTGSDTPNGDVTIGDGTIDAGSVGTKESKNVWDEEW
jgi:hypothetical protein